MDSVAKKMKNIMKKDTIKELKNVILLLFIVIIAVSYVYKIWGKQVDVPYFYLHGDATSSFTVINDIIHGNFIMTDHPIQLLFIWMVSLFTSDIGIIANIFWLSTWIFTALTTYILCRKLQISASVSIMCAVIYDFLPYHYFRLEHASLYSCYTIPISLYLILYVMNSEYKGKTFKQLRKDILINIILSIIIAGNGLYYTFFTCILLGIAFLYSLWFSRDLKVLFIGIALMLVMSVVVYIIIYVWVGGISYLRASASDRQLYQTFYFSLKLLFMIMPIIGHRIPAFDDFARTIYEAEGNFNESYMVSLGLIMSIGLILSIVLTLFRTSVTKKHIIYYMGILNIFTILIASYGGIAVAINYILGPIARCFNRMSIFIALNSVIVIGVIADELLQKYCKKNILKKFILGIIIILGILDQTSENFSKYIYVNRNIMLYTDTYADYETYYYNLKDFIKQIDDEMESGDNIYVTPLTRYHEEAGPYFVIFHFDALNDYDKVSRQAANISLDKEIDWNANLQLLIEEGVEGILYVDDYFEDYENENFEEIIQNYIDSEPIVFYNETMRFYKFK